MGSAHKKGQGSPRAAEPADGGSGDGKTGSKRFKRNGKKKAIVRSATSDLSQEQMDELKASANFFVHGKYLRFASRSLNCLDEASPLRQRVVWLVAWRWFERAILTLILLNTLTLAIEDRRAIAFGYDSDTNTLVARAELVFTVLFALEFVLKVLAMGFFADEGTYLRDPWNWLDFTVVIAGIVGLISA